MPVTDAQLARWHRAGLLPRPHVQRLGRGKGTRSVYPAGTSRRLIRIAAVHQQEHRLGHAAWRLWWEDGGPLAAPARTFLIGVARKLDRQRAEIVQLVDGDAAGDPDAIREMDELSSSMQNDRLPQPLGQARSRVGTAQFPTVGRMLLELVTDRFSGFEADPETGVDDGALLEKSWGLDRARTDRLANSGPWLEGDLAPDLSKLSRLIASTAQLELAQSSDDVLDVARVELREFLVTINTAARMLKTLFGPDAFGYGMFGQLFAVDSAKGQATSLLGWMLLRQDEELHAGMRQFIGLSPQAQATERLYEITNQLRAEVPELADVLSPERLGAAQLNAAENDRLRDEIRAIADANRTEVDSFLARFPDLDELQGLASQGPELGDEPNASD
jgi:hypothetical protein